MPDEWNNPTPSDPRDLLDRDTVLLHWQQAKDVLETAKATEMDWRKYVVKRAFPDGNEGINKTPLGNGYELKASIKYSYKLDSDNKKIYAALDRIAAVGNEGKFIAERLVSFTPNFLLTEYRTLQEAAKDGSEDAKSILRIITEVLTITEAAPTLEIKEPKKK